MQLELNDDEVNIIARLVDNEKYLVAGQYNIILALGVRKKKLEFLKEIQQDALQLFENLLGKLNHLQVVNDTQPEKVDEELALVVPSIVP